MYILPGLGGNPTGECYMSYGKDGSIGLYMHSYSGGSTQLLKFKPAGTGAEAGSLEKRVEDIEKWCKAAERHMDTCLQRLYSRCGMSYVPMKSSTGVSANKFVTTNKYSGLGYKPTNV